MKKLHLIKKAGLLEHRLQKSGIISAYKSSKFYLKFVRPVKHSVTTSIEQSAIIHAIDTLFTRLLYLPLRVYGIFLIAFTIYTSAGSLLKNYLSVASWIDIDTFFGAFFGVVLSSMLLLSPGKEALASAVCDSRIFSYLFFDILGLYKPPFERDQITEGGTWWAFLAATLISLLTVVVSPIVLLQLLLIAVFLKLTLSSPEGGLLLTLGGLPFLPDGVVAVMVQCVLGAYIIKVIRGKRNFRLSVSFVGLFLFLFLVIIGGIRTGGDIFALCSAITVFFLSVLLFTDRVWLMRVASAITVSAVFAAMRGVVIYLLSLVPETYGKHITFIPAEDFPKNMQTPEFFGGLFIAATVLFFVRYLRSGGFSNRILFAISGVLLAAGVIASRSPMVLISVFAALLLMLLMRKWQLVIPYTALSAAAVIGYFFFLPSSLKEYIDQFMLGFSTTPEALLAELKKSWGAFAFGLGQGTADAGNGYTHILVQWGFFGVVFLAITVAWVLCYCILATGVKKETSNARSLLYAFLSAFLGIAVFAVGADIWKNTSILFLFFLILGLVYAASGCLIKESEFENPFSDRDVDIYLPRPKEKRSFFSRKKNGEGGSRR